MRTLPCLIGALSAPFLFPSCLPADDRPPPGRLMVTVSPSPAAQHGTVTADGWALVFRRVLLGIGRVSLGDDCVSYSEARYDRALDVTTVGVQKLSEQFGLGQCDVRFRISPPSADALLGVGVSDTDKTYMRTPGSDRYVPVGGVAVEVDGSASREATTITFRLVFRQTVRYENCGAVVEGRTVPGVNLTGNETVTYDLRIEAERLFLDDVQDASAVLRFDPFAAADSTYGNADGIVDLEELSKIPIAQLRLSGSYGVGSADPSLITTLEDYVYLLLFATLPRYRDTGTCTPTIGGGHHE